MGHKGVECSTITYSTVILACEKGWQWERALGLLEEMGCKGVQLDTITYNG